MGTNEYSQPASKSSWDSQDFGDVNMVVKMAHFGGPLGHNELSKTKYVININHRLCHAILLISWTKDYQNQGPHDLWFDSHVVPKRSHCFSYIVKWYGFDLEPLYWISYAKVRQCT